MWQQKKISPGLTHFKMLKLVVSETLLVINIGLKVVNLTSVVIIYQSEISHLPSCLRFHKTGVLHLTLVLKRNIKFLFNDFKINTLELITRHQLSENHHGGLKGVFSCQYFNQFVDDVWCQPSELGCWRECSARGYKAPLINNQSSLR